MALLAPARARLPGVAIWAVGLAALGVAGWAVAGALDGAALGDATGAMVDSPLGVTAALGAFAAAFGLRAWLWRRVLPALSYGQAWAGLHVALAANHVLPLRLGEGTRVLSVVRRTPVPLTTAAASTVALRATDVVTVMAIAAALAPGAAGRLLGPWAALLVVLVTAAGAFAAHHLRRHARRLDAVAVAGSALAWALEAVVVWQSAAWAGISLSPGDALLVTAVSVAAQVVAVAPGGFGTYEAASVAAYASLGVAPGAALTAAVVAHALTTAYSLVAGAVAVVAPAPGLLGRLRLPRGSVCGAPRGEPPGPSAPVVLFLPARDEEPRVADVVRRAPATVRNHPVEVVVVDDGSTDETAAEAARAGAEVVTLDRQGLGAAARRGLAEAVRRGAAAVAFCDADGEYDPAELERVVAPVLDGEADYVVGSRFAGHLHRRMLRHRRLGNRVLTRALAFVARVPLTDGQSGFRSLSPAAAAAAEIVHDFNYAQVLSLDLLAKGFRYAEVPITYRFRSSGDSFVHLGGYLRHVVPAVWRELNPMRG